MAGKDRILKLFERINAVSISHKQYDLLAKICQIVMPFGFTDARAFKFDLFSLELSVIERLEELLLKEESNLNGTDKNTTKNSKIINNNNNINCNGSMHSESHKEPKSISSSSSSALYINSKTPNTTGSNSHGKNGLRQQTLHTHQTTNNSNNNHTNNNSSNNSNNMNTSKTKEIKTNIIK